jgi:Immunity protein 52
MAELKCIPEFWAGVYWGLRQETSQSCAQRTARFFEKLARVDPSYSRWCGFGRTDEESSRLRVDLTPTSLEGLFRDGVNRYDAEPHRVIEELGFSIDLWNGELPDGVIMSIHCGDYARTLGNNSCILQLPQTPQNIERIFTIPKLTEILRCMISEFDPDWGVVSSTKYLLDFPKPTDKKIPGWVIYLSNRCGTLPPLPEPIRTEPVEDKGTFIIAMPERFSASNPAHVAQADKIWELLLNAGLMD